MAEGIIILSMTVFFCIINFDAIRKIKLAKKPKLSEIIFLTTVLVLNCIFLILKHALILDNYSIFAMYVFFAAAFNFLYGSVNSNLLIYETTSMLAFFTFFITGFKEFNVLFMPVSFIILFLCSANFYRYLINREKSILFSFFTFVFFALSFDFLFFERVMNLQARIFLMLLIICIFSLKKEKEYCLQY